MKKGVINSPAKIFIAIGIILLLLVMVFIGTTGQAIKNSESIDAAYAEAVEASNDNFKVTVNTLRLSHTHVIDLNTDNNLYKVGEPVFIDLTTQSNWATSITDYFLMDLSYVANDGFDISVPGYYKVSPGMPTAAFNSSENKENYTDSDDMTKNWNAIDSISLFSDNGATKSGENKLVDGRNHYMNSGSELIKKVIGTPNSSDTKEKIKE
ncbi:MAG: hypothetical protein J5781_02605, partial [Clostridia bacterium]|nr:hypothetical protein [Clostridia bacterium]